MVVAELPQGAACKLYSRDTGELIADEIFMKPEESEEMRCGCYKMVELTGDRRFRWVSQNRECEYA